LQTPKEARESEIFAVNDRKNPQAPQTPRPLIFLVPPDFGGFSAVDGICAALEERGFTVISYSRGDSGWPGRLLRLWRAFRDGTRLKKANDAGRALEAEKMAELEFLLPYTTENLNSLAPASAGAPLFLAGWGTGASALAYLVSPSGAGGSGRGAAGLVRGPDPPVPYGARGLVVVEGRFWSSRAPAVPPPGNGAAPAGVFGAVLARLRTWFGRLRPERVGEPEAVPRPPIPTLYLVSGRGPDAEDGAYAAVFKALRNSDTPAALASLEGAGPLGYSDLPREYPLYNALLSGRPGGCAEDGAALIARFCELAAAGPLTGGTASSFTGRLHLSDGLYLETRYWNFGDLRLH
jgi:hypothetical protein